MASAAESVAVQALRGVLLRAQQAAERATRPPTQVRVVAVSKTKPVSVLKEIYDAGQRHFGENYVQEIIEKAPQLPPDIEWHFIGHLQSNKAKPLITKYGVDPDQCLEVVKHVRSECPNLVFSGLMTIGMKDYTSTPLNFKMLAQCRQEVCNTLSLEEEGVELSMGMSADFESAIEMGSTNVRVGSTIFGARDYSQK